MPFPNDEQIMKTAGDLIAQLKTLFGSHPGFRPAHAKGKILVGTFTPSAEASKLSRALHFNAPSTKIWLRFSNSTGLPQIPDNVGDADPRGLAIRFHLPEVNGRRMHTDIITHSVPLFPVRTGAEFLELLRAIGASGPSSPDQPSPIEKFLGSHPAALAFVTYPKPLPASYATLQYYGVSAFKLVDAIGRETFIRYNIVPDADVQTLDAGTVTGQDYLQEELSARLDKGPIIFKIVAQVADSSDITDDATVQWPESRERVELGTVKVDSIIPDSPIEQKKVIFDPIPRVDGVEPSDDPLLEMRAAVYLMSGKDRRAA